MIIKALAIFIGEQRAGVLFQYSVTDSATRADAAVVTRFVADDAFIDLVDPPTLSASFLTATREAQLLFWRDIQSTPFNGRFSNRNGWLLPPFFQNLLPEGVFRDHIAESRGCAPNDHFEMLAACGKDLPGNVHAQPVDLSREEMSRYVTQDQDALEMSVTEEPMDDGVSLSGVQPKLAVIKQGDRYVGRTRDHDTHIIAKLPVVGQPRLPELEHLSLQLAAAAGVAVCETYLEPLSRLAVQHGYDLGDAAAKTNFLAVVRYDRAPGQRIHCEDFAQILGEMPEDKYGGAARASGPQTYLNIALALLSFDTLGEPAVHELLRRLVVNEMLGNPDMHLKNIGVRYADRVHPDFPPAYDIVAYAALNNNSGHALLILPPSLMPKARTGDDGRARQALSPVVLQQFCAAADIPLKPAEKVLRDCVKKAFDLWPAMIEASDITKRQKTSLLRHFQEHAFITSLARREAARVRPGKQLSLKL